jgi:hypothetical protein
MSVLSVWEMDGLVMITRAHRAIESDGVPQDRRLVLATGCAAIGLAILVLTVTVLVSTRPPGLWILISLVPFSGWLFVSIRVFQGGAGSILQQKYFWATGGVFHLWAAWLTAAWVANVLAIKDRSAEFVLLNLGVVLVFSGAAFLVYRKLDEARILSVADDENG